MNLRDTIRVKLVEKHGELAVLLNEELKSLTGTGVRITGSRGYWYVHSEADEDKEIGTVFIGDDKMIRWQLYYDKDKHGLAIDIPAFIEGFSNDLLAFLK